MKIFIARFLLVCSFLLSGAFVPAFAVDQWASSVIDYSPGTMKNGDPIPTTRNDPTKALGIADETNADNTFVSLGFHIGSPAGGSLTLKFTNGITDGVFVFESTNPSYPIEHAQVEFSADGTADSWILAPGILNQGGSVSQPEQLPCAQYIRITDKSNIDDFSDLTADGYDVDGVQATEGQSCTVPTPTPTDTPPPPPNNGGPGDGLSDGRSDGGSSCPSCTSSSTSNVLGATTDGQVLGASTDTLAATGSNDQFVRNMIAATAALVVFLLGQALVRRNETS